MTRMTQARAERGRRYVDDALVGSRLVDRSPLEVATAGAALGLAAFSATFWAIGTAMLFLDVRPGLVGGVLVGTAVHRAARP